VPNKVGVLIRDCPRKEGVGKAQDGVGGSDQAMPVGEEVRDVD